MRSLHASSCRGLSLRMLVTNAGIMATRSVCNVRGWFESQLATNHIGPFQLTTPVTSPQLDGMGRISSRSTGERGSSRAERAWSTSRSPPLVQVQRIHAVIEDARIARGLFRDDENACDESIVLGFVVVKDKDGIEARVTDALFVKLHFEDRSDRHSAEVALDS